MGCVISDQQCRWPNSVIPFEIDDIAFPVDSSNRATIQAAIDHWNNNTVIRLRPRRDEQDCVRFVPANESCASPVGRQGGIQTIGCDLNQFSEGSIIHEIGHAAGIYHEHMRQDRNQFVTIDFSNIVVGEEHNFEQQNDIAHDVGPYDYGSVMQYGSKAFAQDNTKNTVTAPPPFDTVIGQREGLSGGDIATVEETYRIPSERFFGVWQKSSRSEKQFYSVSYRDYRAKYDELWPQGWRLHLLNVCVINGQVRYTAVWHRNTHSEIQVYGWQYKDYRAKYDELWPQGWRIHILQPYVINGQVRYTAVWRRSNRSEVQIYGASYENYRAKYDELWPKGWRLRLLQPYVLNGQVKYTAVWYRSRRREIQVYGWSYKNYRAKYDELWPKGWRLHLLQPYRIGEHIRYTAVWHLRPKQGEYQGYNWNYADFRGSYDEKWPKDWRLRRIVVI